jgi:hypothetical protein
MALTENQIEICTFVLKDMLRQVVNNLQFTKNCSDGDGIAEKFKAAPKKGESISMTKPVRFNGGEGEVFTPEAYLERTIQVQAYTNQYVHLQLTNRELMFKMEKERISERIVKPAAETLANKLDRQFLQLATLATFEQRGHAGNGADVAEDLQPGAREDELVRRTAERTHPVDLP